MTTRTFSRVLLLFLSLTMTSACQADNTPATIKSSGYTLAVETVVEGLVHPWGMVFLPDGNILVTERPGRLRLVQDGKLHPDSIRGVPEVSAVGQGGLLDVALHPDYANNKLIYLSFAAAGEGGLGTEVVRGRLEGMQLKDVVTIFVALPKADGGRHFGSRLLFGTDGKLYITLGDRGERERAQKPDQHPGSLIRVNDDGSVPEDNPFSDFPGAKPENYTLGNRNMQGIALQPSTELIWTHEHGPQGGDEVNVMRAGVNYGWPVITYGVNYTTGTKIGEGTEKEGMAQPVHYWVPSIAPSGMVFYTGDEFPEWKGDLFVGSLKFGQLVRLELAENMVVHEERMINGALGRIRDVRQGPDDALYLLTDENNGKLIRLTRQN
ncbi:MAG TPA: PQQ-dependent sugar dehydrogenase [Gammaproteobacteria bacterium]|nr:PQQ-dependent sugar dehydrogenase [Gammaproteobacteria bacterium]